LSEQPFCPKCGWWTFSFIAYPKEEWKYCPRCGTKLEWRKIAE